MFRHCSFAFLILSHIVFMQLFFLLVKAKHDIPISKAPYLSEATKIVPRTSQKQGLALAGESCTLNSDCSRNECIILGPKPCSGFFDCICAVTECVSDSDCLVGETCMEFSDGNACLSKNSRRIKRNGGLTFAKCRTVADCATDRDCYRNDRGEEAEGSELCNPSAKSCSCMPLIIDKCATVGSTAGCDTEGEVCSNVSEEFNACIDAKVASQSSTPEKSPEKSPEKPEDGAGSGLTFETCRTDSTCAGTRLCMHASDGKLENCNESHNICLCSPRVLQECEVPADCSINGETCVRFNTLSKSYCVSEIVAPAIEKHEKKETESGDTPTDCGKSPLEIYERCVKGLEGEPEPPQAPETPVTVPAVCIDAKALSHLSKEGLVFETHKHAVVLCDINGSCATGGHMVLYRGLPMMMRTYCGIIQDGCKKEVMQVNSPKWRKQIRIKSNTAQLEYLAFAARYETKAEEIILKNVVHMGL